MNRASRLQALGLIASLILGSAARAHPGDPVAAENGGPRSWEVATALNLRRLPSVRAEILAQFPRGTLLDNLGCRRVEDETWCDVQQLGGGPRGYVSAAYLTPAVAPDGSVAVGPDDSALRAGRGEFDAVGTVPCGQRRGQPLEPCPFCVARAGGGYATVVIERPSGRERMIYFRMGRAIGASMSEVDRGGRFRATKEADLNRIEIGEERYDVPDAVVLGD